MVIPCKDLSNFLKNSVFSEIYWTFFFESFFYTFLLSRWEKFNGPFIFMDHFFPSTPTVFYWSVKYDCIWYSTGDDGNYLQSRISYICQKLKKYESFHRSGHILIFRYESLPYRLKYFLLLTNALNSTLQIIAIITYWIPIGVIFNTSIKHSRRTCYEYLKIFSFHELRQNISYSIHKIEFETFQSVLKIVKNVFKG